MHSSGLKVVTTCSPRNFDLVKNLGADAVYDYVRFHTLLRMTLVTDLRYLPAGSRLCPEDSLIDLQQSYAGL